MKAYNREFRELAALFPKGNRECICLKIVWNVFESCI